MLDLQDVQVPELLEQIFEEHYYEVVVLSILLLTAIFLRLFSDRVLIVKRVKMPAASPATVRPSTTPAVVVGRETLMKTAG